MLKSKIVFHRRFFSVFSLALMPLTIFSLLIFCDSRALCDTHGSSFNCFLGCEFVRGMKLLASVLVHQVAHTDVLYGCQLQHA